MSTVILGNGYAAIKTALELSKNEFGNITLISESHYFIHHGALRDIALGKDPARIPIAIEDIFAAHPNVKVVIAHSVMLDAERKLVTCGRRSYGYNALIVCLDPHVIAPSLSLSNDHLDTPRQVQALHDTLESTISEDAAVDRPLLVVGSNRRAVEVAGALAYRRRQLHTHHAPRRAETSVILASASKSLLEGYSKQASRKVSQRLAALGVEVHLNTHLRPDAHNSILVGRRKLPVASALWLEQSQAHGFFRHHRHYFDIDESGFIKVNPYLEAYRDIYVIGESTAFSSHGPRDAIDMARYICNHLMQRASGELISPYRPSANVIAVPVGRDWAYVEALGIYITGRIGYGAYQRLSIWGLRQILSESMARTVITSNTT